MLKIFKRNKVQEDKVATIFVDNFLTTVDQGFSEVAALVNESPEFVSSPNISSEESDAFLLIALAANLMAVEREFKSHKDQTIKRKIVEAISELCETNLNDLTQAINKLQGFISKVNHPSNNLIYGMSKAFFYKYKLNAFQEEYFRNLNSPNPIFIKRLDDAMLCFMWDWEEIANN